MRPDTMAPEARDRTGTGTATGASPRASRAQPRLSCTAMWALGPLVPIAALAAVTSSTPASAQTRRTHNVVMSGGEGGRRLQEAGGHSDAVAGGDTISLSGAVAGLREGEDIGVACGRTDMMIVARRLEGVRHPGDARR